MTHRVLSTLFLPWLVCSSALTQAQSAPPAGSMGRTLEMEKRTRSYLLHAPANLPTNKLTPLVLVFHGGGGDGADAEQCTKFSPLADKEGFIVVYPDGVSRHWNDGRAPALSGTHRVDTDDVAFVEAIIADLETIYPINPNRIYATGISNGGMFAHYLAARLANRIAAIAPVAGGIAEPFAEKFKPDAPVSVFIIQGTDDPLVPYHGGGMLHGIKGSIVDTDTAVKMWRERDGCNNEAVTGELPDSDPTDHCHVKWARWSKGRKGTEVVLYSIMGGGHTWPGGPQYLPPNIIGRVCRDFEASPIIWEFFKKHPKL